MIPAVDIGCYTDTKNLNSDDVKLAVRQLHDAISEYGFCYLTNHGVPQQLVDDVFKSSRSFFNLPVTCKQTYARPADTEGNHGWVSLERERLNPDRPYADLKEAFNYEPTEKRPMPSKEVPEIADHFQQLYSHCRQLSKRVLDLIGLALDIKEVSFLRDCHKMIGEKGNRTMLRSLYYPSSGQAVKGGQLQCSEHSDYGSVTLLFQDHVGGLQVLGKDGQYHDVPPLPEAVLVNIGDLMQRWTADKYPSTKHRVIVPEEAFKVRGERQSLAFFVHPDDDTVITCLDGSNKYAPITSYAYLMERFGLIY